MIKPRSVVKYLPVLLVLLFSCREIYNPEELETGKSIPVIQGRIVKNESPSVVISRAMDYESQEPDYISGAEVIVTDDKGNTVTLTESTPGHYFDAMNEMPGETGTGYKLEVKTGGEEFVSSMVTIPDAPVIDSLYAVQGTKEFYSYNVYNQPVSTTFEGLYIETSLTATGESTVYYRFNTAVIEESTCVKYPGTMRATPMYLWEPSTLDGIYSVDFTIKSDNREVRPEHPNGFLKYFVGEPESEDYSTRHISCWIITLKVYAIPLEVYNYYNSIGKQLNSNDQIFAPVPSQIKSNIRCTTNPLQLVTGVFEATSYITLYKAFRWVNKNTFTYKNLESFPEGIKKGFQTNYPPEFWISF